MSGAPDRDAPDRPLHAKLGLKSGQRVLLIGEPANYHALVEGAAPGIEWHTAQAAGGFDLIHWFVRDRADLERALPGRLGALTMAGALWVSWPKGRSGDATDLTENVIRETALPLGLVDVKVCSVDPTWSGLKLVRRLEARRD